jgi:diadenosine tetraphosphate (Ap4A) HIT family hydrolase
VQDFILDPRIEADSLAIGDLPLSALRLMRDRNYPWLLLVPRRPDLAELIDLDADGQLQLMAEVAACSQALRRIVACDKLNVAALGNVVRQLHVHVIARRTDDPAWPRPVWGAVPPLPYPPGEGEALAARLRDDLTVLLPA